MATSVTIPGGATGSGAPTISVPFTSAANAAAAQAALSALASPILAGFQSVYQATAGNQTPPSPTFSGTIASTTVPGAHSVGVVSSPFNSLVDASAGPMQAAITGSGTWTVVSGNGSSLAMLNAGLNASPTQVFFGGGFNAFTQAPYAPFAGEKAVVNVDGTTPATGNVINGGAVIQAPLGSTTVNVYPNAIVDVSSVGSSATAVVNMLRDTTGIGTYEAVQVDGANSAGTGTVTVNGASGVNFTYIATSGAGFVNPNGANVTVNGAGGGGSVTVAAGVSSLYAVGTTGELFGGSAGGNSLQTSTVSGTSTLFGGGNSDYLELDGKGQTAFAGSGTGVKVAGFGVSGADVIYSGNGSGTLQGGLSGGNAIALAGTGTYTVFGVHPTSITAGTGNFFIDSVGGGTYTIEDFTPKAFGLAANDVVQLGAGVTASLAAAPGTGSFTSTLATLSDGTKITFQNIALSSLTNSGGTIS